MGVQWHSSLVGENCGDSTRLVNMDTFSNPMANPLKAIEDEAEEDSILDDANLDVHPGTSEEEPEAYNECFLTLFSRPRRAQVNSSQAWENSFPTI